MEGIEQKKQILSRATMLRALPETDAYSKVYIRPDMTKKQVVESKNLYELLKQKRLDYPQQTWKITRGRIIEVEGQQTNAEVGEGH